VTASRRKPPASASSGRKVPKPGTPSQQRILGELWLAGGREPAAAGLVVALPALAAWGGGAGEGAGRGGAGGGAGARAGELFGGAAVEGQLCRAVTATPSAADRD
jgi:hypothetical protein